MQRGCQYKEGILVGSVLFITVTNYLEKQVLNEVTEFADTRGFFKLTKTNTDNKRVNRSCDFEWLEMKCETKFSADKWKVIDAKKHNPNNFYSAMGS